MYIIKIILLIIIASPLASCALTSNKELASELRKESQYVKPLTNLELENLLINQPQLDAEKREDPSFGENNSFGAYCKVTDVDLKKSPEVGIKCTHSFKDHSKGHKRHRTKYKKKNMRAALCPTTLDVVKYFGYEFPVVSGVKLKKMGESREDSLRAFNALEKLCLE